MEAMSCGLAVVSTKVGNIKNYIKDNYNGIFFKKQDAYQLSKKIEYLLQDKERRISLGQNARKTIVQLYDWKKTAEEIKKVLNNIKS
jgi:glycosyltransferase involved in cell wall biosynthesis